MDALSHTDPAALWAPRRQLTLAQARKRSERVIWLRLLFSACAAVSIGLFIGFIVRSAVVSETNTVDVSATETITMINPRFTGRDSVGKSFQITADAARRRMTMNSAIDLTNPVLRNDDGGLVMAPSGMYDRDAGILELYEDVRISDAEGFVFMTSGARIYVDEGRVEGLSPLQGRGPLGDIQCDSYEVLDDGDRVVCQGNVKTVIYPEPAGNSAPVEEEPIDESDSNDAP